MTNNVKARRRFPAEWEESGAVLLAWPHEGTDWAYMLDEVQDCYRHIIEAILPETRVILVTPEPDTTLECLKGVSRDGLIVSRCATDDTWARDFGPITVEVDGVMHLLDFQFNGWGLKFAACHDNLITSRLSEAGIFAAPVENRRGFVLEGGSVESDGRGTLLTTSECLLSPNRNAEMSRAMIDSYLRDAFGVDTVLWLDHGALAGDDTDSHIDTLCRLAPDDTILYTCTDNRDDMHFESLQAMKEQLQHFRTAAGMPFRLMELPLPDPVEDPETGERLPATYANYLALAHRIIMPVYGQPVNDRLAAETIARAFPGHEVVTVDCRALVRQHGSLHCVTMQLPQGVIAKF